MKLHSMVKSSCKCDCFVYDQCMTEESFYVLNLPASYFSLLCFSHHTSDIMVHVFYSNVSCANFMFHAHLLKSRLKQHETERKIADCSVILILFYHMS